MEYKREIRAWTIEFSILIIRLVKEMEKCGVEYPVRDQLLRAGTSIGANVHEGKTSISEKELIRYLTVALKSANETEYWLKILKEGYGISSDLFMKCSGQAEEIKKVLATIIIKLKNKQLAEEDQLINY